MKNQANLTPHQLETWAATLSIFDFRIVNEAVIRIALDPLDPFPAVAKIVAACERLRRERAGTWCEAASKKPSSALVAKVAAALELEIE